MNNNKKAFRRFIVIYTLVLIIFSIATIVHVRNILIEYERADIKNFVVYTINNINKKQAQEYLNDMQIQKSIYETSNKKSIDVYMEMLNKKDFTIKEVSENVYDVYNGNMKIFQIEVEEKETKQKLGLLNYTVLSLKTLTPYLEKGILSYTIKIPSNYEIQINDIKVDTNTFIKKEKIANIEDMYYYSEMPYILTYEINNLLSEPKISIINEKGENIGYRINNNEIHVGSFKNCKTQEEAKQYISTDIDISNILKSWSLYLTNDLNGGFNTIKQYLIKDTYMYKMAYNWAHSIDSTFINKHSFKNPAFTNERICNFIIYDENAFSCEAYIEKNMLVSGKDKVDIIYDRLYFIKYSNQWKLVAMEAITNNEEKK